MSEDYSDDETLELQEEENSTENQRWPGSNSSERIRRSRASTDIAALQQMDNVDMEEDSGREEEHLEMEEHVEALPQQWIVHYKDKFNTPAFNNKWSPPPLLDDRFHDLVIKALEMCESGHADGTVELFLSENMNPLFRKWYCSGEGMEHWSVEIYNDLGETVFKVLKMLRGLLVAGAGSRDIPTVLWDLMFYVTSDTRTNMIVGERLFYLSVELDESAERELIKSEHWNNAAPIHKYIRAVILVIGKEGFQSIARFFKENITASTSIEEISRYLKAFRWPVILLNNDKAFSTFAEIIYTCLDRLREADDDEKSVKNLRGPITDHPLFALYLILITYVGNIIALQANYSTLLGLLRWRLSFSLRALMDAPFGGRMFAVESLTSLIVDFTNYLPLREHLEILHKWLEEERFVDQLTRDNLHNQSYVERVKGTFEQMLIKNIFTTADLSTLWEAQRGKHDVIQRNFADLIVRIAPHFDNELLEGLFMKIQAGWVDGGVRERDMLVEIVKKIGENSAMNMNNQRAWETDQAQFSLALETLWKFARQRIPGSEKNESSALQAHLKLLDDCHSSDVIRAYLHLCATDIKEQNEMASTSALHIVNILELVEEDEENDDDDYDYPSGSRYGHVTGLQESHNLVLSVCSIIMKTVKSPDSPARTGQLSNFIHLLSFALQSNRDIRLSEKQACELWKTLVSDPLQESDKKLGFKFFLHAVSGLVIEGAMMERFFNSKVLVVPPETISVEGYQCFEAFFKSVNDLQDRDIQYFQSPENLLGAPYLRQLILTSHQEVYHRACGLWVEYLHKIIDRVSQSAMTAKFVQAQVDLISEQYESMGEAVKSAAERGMSLMNFPLYESARLRTLRSIKVLKLLIVGMDDDAGLGKRSEPALMRAVIGRPIFISCKVTRREWESVPQQWRGNTRHDELDLTLEVHENTTFAEARELIKRILAEKMSRKRTEYDEILEQFLLVWTADDGGKTFHFSDFKRTLGELGLREAAEMEVRFSKSNQGMRNGGDESPETSTSEGDWISPEDLLDDGRESCLPSRALSADEEMIDRLLNVAESGDAEVATKAFQILMLIPPNRAMLDQLHGALLNTAQLQALLGPTEASDCRFLYNIMMLESIILPAESNIRTDPQSHMAALRSMVAFMRILPRVADLSMLMNRALPFRTLAALSITRIINLACMTAARIEIGSLQSQFGQNNSLSGMILNVMRMSTLPLPAKWSKHIRTRRVSSAYEQYGAYQNKMDLMNLVETHTTLLMRVFCAVIMSGSSFNSYAPQAVLDETANILTALLGSSEPLLHEDTMETDAFVRCSVNALLESAVYGIALLSCASALKCAELIGAVSTGPSPLFVQTVVAGCFNKAESVRMMMSCFTIESIEVIRASLSQTNELDKSNSNVSLTSVILDLIPFCRGTCDKGGEQFIHLVKECVCRSKGWNSVIERVDAHIDAGVEFLEEALLHANAHQSPFQDDSYLRSRIEVLRYLIRDSSNERRLFLGSGEGGPRLCERLIADFIFPAARVVETQTAPSESVVEPETLPRSVTHMEMNSSSSLFELRGDSALPRSLSALPISSRRVPVCNGEGSQEGAFQLLLVLCDCLPANQVLMHNTIHRLFYSGPWTDKKDFDYLPQHTLRREGDLVGLKNGGATCYMNSIFQQLFMIDELREAVLNVNIPEDLKPIWLPKEEKPKKEEKDEKGEKEEKVELTEEGQPKMTTEERFEYAVKVLAAIQTLFAHLLGTELDAYRPSDFWKVFNFKPTGESVNVREQQDAVEFHNMLTELIDNGLRGCGAEPICEKLFKGTFADEKICKDCPHRFSKEEPFESLSLDIRSHNNMRDSLRAYVKGDVLENDNAYACELCEKKVKAVKRMSLCRLPEVLIVQLKRFDFDWEKEMSVKFNDYFEFPNEIDMQPFTDKGMEKLEKGELLEENKDLQYSLRGVLVHSGQAQGGHYTSYIRNRETGKWYKFDDSEVTPWDPTDGQSQQRWFGLGDCGMDSMGRGRKKPRITYWNAYVLFYDKIETAQRYLAAGAAAALPSSIASDMSTSSGVSSMAAAVPTAVSPSPISSSVNVPSLVSPSTSAASSSTATASTSGTTTVSAVAASPIAKEGVRSMASSSPVSNLHRHFSSMSLSSARIRMPPRLEEMLREQNRRVQLERVQYSTHYFTFIAAATGKALATAELNPDCAEVLSLAAMKSFSSFIVHNGLFASKDLMSDESVSKMMKCSFKTWLAHMNRLLRFPTARLWFITHVLFAHDIAACFLFSSDPHVREFFQLLITETIALANEDNDQSDACLRQTVVSPVALQLAHSIRQFPRLSHLLANLLGMIPFKHNAAFRSEAINFYRTIIGLADRRDMMPCIVRSGILNNLLSLFPPIIMHTDLSSLQRRDMRVYEDLHRVIANGIRSIRVRNGALLNPYASSDSIVYTDQVPDLRVFIDFQQGNGGHVKFMHHLVDFLRRASRSSGDLEWATDGILYLCWTNERASTAVMDIVCQGLGNMLSETATDLLLKLTHFLFGMKDGLAQIRYEHIFFRVQLTSTHAHPSVQGLVELKNVAESRYEVLIRVAHAAIMLIPGAREMLSNDNRLVQLLNDLNTIAAIRSPQSKHCQQFHTSFEEIRLASSTPSVSNEGSSVVTRSEESDSVMESSSMEDETKSDERSGERPSSTRQQHEHIIVSGGDGIKRRKTSLTHFLSPQNSSSSPGQLSPSSRMGAMTLSNVGEKRPLPPTEEGEETDESTDGRSDRKRSIGETMWRSGGGGGATTSSLNPSPVKTDDYAACPMDDRELLISSSIPSTSRGPPTMPPPAYETIGAPPAVAAAPRATPLSPPPLPPRPNIQSATAKNQPKPNYGTDEFVQKHKE